MKPALIAALLLLGGCAGVPASIVWTTVGAGLGYVASVNRLADDLFRYETRPHDAGPEPGAP